MYHGLILENKTAEERAEFEAILEGQDKAKGAQQSVDAIRDGLLAGGDINELFAEFG